MDKLISSMKRKTMIPGNQKAMDTREDEVESPSIFDLNYVLNSCSNFSPDLEEEERASKPTLNLLEVNYEVKERVGPWWKGACFRKQRKKTVLRDVTMQLKSGLLTAILGSSGSVTLVLNFQIIDLIDSNQIWAFYWSSEINPTQASFYFTMIQAGTVTVCLTLWLIR